MAKNTPPSKHQYFAVASPKNCEMVNDTSLIFTEKKEALETLRKYKGLARFKVFDNYDDAVEYSKNGFEENYEVADKKSTIDAEKASSSGFRAPEPPQLSHFRKMIESSNISEVKQLVSSNPRYLISYGDTPVILMAGPRYNAFHIASKTNQFEILKFLLDTLKSKSFMQKLYPVDEEITTKSRINQIVDKYLNTPDQAANDTPLHFASKFGSKECVLLLLNEGCDINFVNKQGKKAFDVICERKGDQNIRHMIQNFFHSRYYVPLFRNMDGVFIGCPCTQVPIDESVKAVAGPMSPTIAEQFYRNLRSPAMRANKDELCIRLSDSHKGVERIARSICKSANIIWAEYWPFLDCNIDLSSIEGLNRFEQHLRSVHNKLLMSSDNPSVLNSFKDICKKLNDLKMTNDRDLNLSTELPDSPEVFVTAPSSPPNLDVFVEGNKLSNWDINAALALSEVEIDKKKYPYITAWLQRLPKESLTSPVGALSRNLSQNHSTPRRFRPLTVKSMKSNIFEDCE